MRTAPAGHRYPPPRNLQQGPRCGCPVRRSRRAAQHRGDVRGPKVGQGLQRGTIAGPGPGRKRAAPAAGGSPDGFQLAPPPPVERARPLHHLTAPELRSQDRPFPGRPPARPGIHQPRPPEPPHGKEGTPPPQRPSRARAPDCRRGARKSATTAPTAGAGRGAPGRSPAACREEAPLSREPLQRGSPRPELRPTALFTRPAPGAAQRAASRPTQKLQKFGAFSWEASGGGGGALRAGRGEATPIPEEAGMGGGGRGCPPRPGSESRGARRGLLPRRPARAALLQEAGWGVVPVPSPLARPGGVGWGVALLRGGARGRAGGAGPPRCPAGPPRRGGSPRKCPSPPARPSLVTCSSAALPVRPAGQPPPSPASSAAPGSSRRRQEVIVAAEEGRRAGAPPPPASSSPTARAAPGRGGAFPERTRRGARCRARLRGRKPHSLPGADSQERAPRTAAEGGTSSGRSPSPATEPHWAAPPPRCCRAGRSASPHPSSLPSSRSGAVEGGGAEERAGSRLALGKPRLCRGGPARFAPDQRTLTHPSPVGRTAPRASPPGSVAPGGAPPPAAPPTHARAARKSRSNAPGRSRTALLFKRWALHPVHTYLRVGPVD